MTDTTNAPVPRAWSFGRHLYAANKGMPRPRGHRWISVERHGGDLVVYLGRQWWIAVTTS